MNKDCMKIKTYTGVCISIYTYFNMSTMNLLLWSHGKNYSKFIMMWVWNIGTEREGEADHNWHI